MKKLALLSIFIALPLCSFSFGQWLQSEAKPALALPSRSGKLLAYSFPIYLGIWNPTLTVGKCKWETGTDIAQMCTLNGGYATEIRINNVDDICSGGGCSFDGFFMTYWGRPNVEYYLMPDGSTASRVGGTVRGNLTYPAGYYDPAKYPPGSYSGPAFSYPAFTGTVNGRCYFETYPQVNGIDVPAPGGCAFELAPNQ